MPMYNCLFAGIDWQNDTIKVALFPSTFTPDPTTQTYYSDISAQEITGAGYTAGGVTLGSKTRPLAEPFVNFGAANITYSAVTVTGVEWAVVYKSTGTGSTSRLIGYIDIRIGNPPQVITGVGININVPWSASGVAEGVYILP